MSFRLLGSIPRDFLCHILHISSVIWSSTGRMHLLISSPRSFFACVLNFFVVSSMCLLVLDYPKFQYRMSGYCVPGRSRLPLEHVVTGGFFLF